MALSFVNFTIDVCHNLITFYIDATGAIHYILLYKTALSSTLLDGVYFTKKKE